MISIAQRINLLKKKNDGKIAFLLELTGDAFAVQDRKIYLTSQYIFDKLSLNYPIFDTEGQVEKTIEILDELYEEGYKIFIGFSRSSLLENVLDWFNTHTDTWGISLTSTAPDLSIPKRVFRMTPPDNLILNWYETWIKLKQYQSVIILREENDIFAENLNTLLHERLNSLLPVVSFIYNPSDLITQLSSYRGQNVLIIPLIVTDKNSYLEQLGTLPNYLVFDQLENVGESPPILPSQTARVFDNKYYFMSFNPQYERMISSLINSLGLENSSLILWDSIQLAQQLQKSNDIGYIIGSYGYLYFNQYLDRIWDIFLIRQFSLSPSPSWLPIREYGIDPSLGPYQKVFSINPPI